MSVDLSGETTAIATAVLAAFAIVTAVFAFLAYRKQSQEVNVLQQQLKDQLEATARQAAASELQAKQQPHGPGVKGIHRALPHGRKGR